MMEAALAVRGYTIAQVRPHLEMQLMRAFLPQSVPAFAAAETMGELRKKYPDYFYKEATLNPTNPRNRAADWEADLVQEFRNRPDREGARRRARHADGPRPLHRAAHPDQQPRLPRLPQHAGCGAGRPWSSSTGRRTASGGS